MRRIWQDHNGHLHENEVLAKRYNHTLVATSSQIADTPLIQTVEHLAATNLVVRYAWSWYRHSQEGHCHPVALGTVLAYMIALLDKAHTDVEKLALDTLLRMPGAYPIIEAEGRDRDQGAG